MRRLSTFLFVVVLPLLGHGAEVNRSLFDLQLVHPKELWFASASTNQQRGDGELMLVKDGKGKIVFISTEVRAAESPTFNVEDVKRLQNLADSPKYKTSSQQFNNFLGERAYRIASQSTELRGSSVSYFFYRGVTQFRVMAVCFGGSEPEADQEIASIVKSMKFAK